MIERIAVILFLSSPAFAAVVDVSTPSELAAAIASAEPGDEIVLSDGTYELQASPTASANGTSSLPIMVRAENRHGARIRFNTTEGFRVTGHNWIFDGLDVQGTCVVDSDCEHAFHVFGDAQGFVLRNSRIYDFNAQVKVNASQARNGVWQIPHGGLIERNELFDTHPRMTSKPVTKLNIDTGDGWVVRDNLIYDFHKLGGDNTSYGAFMKSGGKDGVFERNLVICAHSLTTGGVRLGLSFGGGGTAPAFCAPAFDSTVPCDPEHTGGVMRNNVIATCSDVGIYLNKATDTKVLFNTLIDTLGVDFRFASSSGEAHGNVLSGVVRTREGASLQRGTNLENVTTATFNKWYAAPPRDLRVEGDVSELFAGAPARDDVPDDFCARGRPTSGDITLGAIEHALGDCETWPGEPQPAPDAGTSPDAGKPKGGGFFTPGGGGGTAPSAETTGCGCTSGTGGAFGAVFVLLAATLRRRARSPR